MKQNSFWIGLFGSNDANSHGLAATTFDRLLSSICSDFVNIHFDHEFMEANDVVHELVGLAKGSNEPV
jgi:hypothetical protein